jgi:signal transduction histidine kinase
MHTALWAERQGQQPDFLPPSEAAIDAHRLLLDVVRDCQGDIDAKRLHVFVRLLSHHYHFSDGGDRLRQLYRNLLNTAVAGAPIGGDLTLRTSSPAHCALRVEIEEQSAPRKAKRPMTESGRKAGSQSAERTCQ